MPLQITCASALHVKTGKHENHIFHSIGLCYTHNAPVRCLPERKKLSSVMCLIASCENHLKAHSFSARIRQAPCCFQKGLIVVRENITRVMSKFTKGQLTRILPGRFDVRYVAFSALTLLVGCQQEHLACRK